MLGDECQDTQLDDQVLVELVERISADVCHGIPVDEEALCGEFPQFAEQLRDVVPTLKVLADLGHSWGNAGQLDPGTAPKAPLGDFNVLREIGRGGMGIVYEAEQLSLGRRVALKVLPFAAVLGETQLQRFKNEARAAATLNHPNIVAVYAVGCHRGMHFFAMQLINGESLASILDELRVSKRAEREHSTPASKTSSSWCLLQNEAVSGEVNPELHSAATGPVATNDKNISTPPARDTEGAAAGPTAIDPAYLNSKSYCRTVARLGVQAAEALHHAHENGVIHRDVKPGNLMLDKDGKLWITDFGLAQLQRDTGVTMSGDLVGTLRYMSPEQASGKRGVIDEGTDIYSLCATLYELLTLCPCFPGDDRQALLRQIEQLDPPPPAAINPAIPADLQTIILKGLTKHRAERYATAADLAADLRCYLECCPISAKPPSYVQRLQKWAARHHTLVISAGVCTLLLLAASIISNLVIGHQRNRATQMAEEAQQQALRAEANLQLALLGVNEIMDRLANEKLKDVPQLHTVRAETTERAVQLLEQIASHNIHHVGIRGEIARAHVQLGHLRASEGRHDEGEHAFREAISIYDELIAIEPDESAHRLGIAAALDHLGDHLRNTSRTQDARTVYYRAMHHLQHQLAGQSLPPAEQVSAERMLAEVHCAVGLTLTDDSCFAEAEAEYQNALNIYSRMRHQEGDFEIQKGLAVTLFNLGVMQFQKSTLPDAEKSTRQALRLFAALLEESPTTTSLREFAALANSNLAVILQRTGRSEEAIETVREHVAMLKRITLEFPELPEYRDELAVAYGNLGKLLRGQGDVDSAETASKAAVDTLRPLVEQYPHVAAYRLHLASYENNLGSVRWDQKQPEAAISQFKRAVQNNTVLLETHPDVAEYLEYYARHAQNLAKVLTEVGQHEESEATLNRAIEMLANGTTSTTHQLRRTKQLIDCWWTLGNARLAAEQVEEAMAAFRQSLTIADRACSSHPEVDDLRVSTARHHGLLAHHLYWNVGTDNDKQAALDEVGKAVDMLTQLVKGNGSDRKYRLLLAAVLGDQGTMLSRMGSEAAAVASYRRSLETYPIPGAQNQLAWLMLTSKDHALRNVEQAVSLAETAVDKAPDNLAYRATLAVGYYRLGMFERVLEVTDEVLDAEDETATLLLLTRAISLRQVGRPTDAEACYKAALPCLERGGSLNEMLKELVAEANSLWGDRAPTKSAGDNSASDDGN